MPINVGGTGAAKCPLNGGGWGLKKTKTMMMMLERAVMSPPAGTDGNKYSNKNIKNGNIKMRMAINPLATGEEERIYSVDSRRV